MSILNVERIKYTYYNNQLPLNIAFNLSISIQTNEVVAICGPSGCGKSTILKCMAGVLFPEEGKITIDNVSPTTASKNKMIGIAFQQPTLLPWKTCLDNILLPLHIGKINDNKKYFIEKAKKLVEMVGLKEFENFYPNQLSGGMKQRVALARALLLEPSVLLLDEPFGGLDLITRTQIMVDCGKFLKSPNMCTVLVTHSIEEAVFLADRILILSPRPCRIIGEVTTESVNFKSMETFNNEDFLNKVNDCRNLIFKNAN